MYALYDSVQVLNSVIVGDSAGLDQLVLSLVLVGVSDGLD